MTTHLTIQGYVVGPIWQPGFDNCFKPFTYDVQPDEPGTLRDHVLKSLIRRTPK
jgi:hypothetical protein